MNNSYSLNIYGSTGQIGSKSLKILTNFFPKIKINLLVANKNYKKLIKQANLYSPKAVCLLDKKKIKYLKKYILFKKIEIVEPIELLNFIKSVKSDISLLAISGYNALNFLPSIFLSTKIVGIVNKECIVSGGHLFNQLIKKNNVKIFPLDSEHYSLFQYFNNLKKSNINNIKNIFLTASGGPFYNKELNTIKNASFHEVLKHPKWKMGYKNSIDSATMSNKCLEIIEAHYLFNFSFEKLKIIIHPEALVHSIVEFQNYTSVMNYFYHDMAIPIFNFFSYSTNNKLFPSINYKYSLNLNNSFFFYSPKKKQYPILRIFNKIEKSDPKNLIKFNCANEFAVNLFANKLIKFGDIHRIIEDSMSIDINMNVNNIKSVLNFQIEYINKLTFKLTKKYT